MAARWQRPCPQSFSLTLNSFHRMNLVSAHFIVATILRQLPDWLREQSSLLTIRNAYVFGYANPLWSYRSALQLGLKANMETAVALGNGNEALRRAQALKANRTQYQAKHSSGKLGPKTDFKSPILFWIEAQAEPSEWTCEMVSEQTLQETQDNFDRQHRADLIHDEATEARSFPRDQNLHCD